METLPEPWLRGPVSGVDPLLAPMLHAFQQAREDLAMHTEGLGVEEIWASPYGFGSLGFHIRHIARSTDRLATYLRGQQLSGNQLAELRAEQEPGATRAELLAELDPVSSVLQNWCAHSIPLGSPKRERSAAKGCRLR